MADAGNIDVGLTLNVTLHVMHHFPDGPVPIAIDPATVLTVLTAHSTRAESAKLGVSMTAITVDETGEIATVSFQDDKGNATTAPAGTVATFASSDTSILTVDNSVDNLTGVLTPVGVGTATLSVALAGADGNPLTNPDGSLFPSVDPADVEVDPGAAVSVKLTLSDTTP